MNTNKNYLVKTLFVKMQPCLLSSNKSIKNRNIITSIDFNLL